jgi:hypothetical protein
MDYRYLQATGALNDTATASARREGPARGGGTLAFRGRRIPREAMGLVPESLVRELLVFPIASGGGTITLAAVDPGDIALKDRLTFVLNMDIRLVPADRQEILSLIQQYYGAEQAESVDSMLQEFTDTAVGYEDEDDDESSFGTRTLPASPRLAAAVTEFKKGLRGTLPEMSQVVPRLRDRPQTDPGLDPTRSLGGSGVFTCVVEEGQRVLMRRPNGTMEIVVGPNRVWRGRNVFQKMQHYVAHPGEYLIVRFRDGRQEHLPGPSQVWFDPRVHQAVTREDALQVAAKEAVVVYSSKEGTSAVQRRVEYGPTLFFPRPGEWLHTFSWHASEGGSQGARKIPKGLVFQKLWLMPDQMYHDVPDVRTADDAVLTIRLMMFFELIDIARMLETTHDPIGDFVNAATSDVVDFTGRHDFESFKKNTDKLNELETYRQLIGRAEQCGYRINKVVYRGYGAPDRLQQMHDQAIEARTRLQLERATEQQAQDLENFKLDSQMARATKRRREQSSEVEHDLALGATKQEAEMRGQESRRSFQREQTRLDSELRDRLRCEQDGRLREHLSALKEMGVDLTAYLTQSRADRVIELRGSNGGTHVHLDPSREAEREEPVTMRDGNR